MLRSMLEPAGTEPHYVSGHMKSPALHCISMHATEWPALHATEGPALLRRAGETP